MQFFATGLNKAFVKVHIHLLRFLSLKTIMNIKIYIGRGKIRGKILISSHEFIYFLTIIYYQLCAKVFWYHFKNYKVDRHFKNYKVDRQLKVGFSLKTFAHIK